MTDKAKKYLSDIQHAISLIENFMQNTDNYSDFEIDKKTQSAVERQLGIIGEAVNKFRQEEITDILTHTKEIVNFRNRLIHSYDNIDNSIVWIITKNHLPVLKEEIERLIGASLPTCASF